MKTNWDLKNLLKVPLVNTDMKKLILPILMLLTCFSCKTMQKQETEIRFAESLGGTIPSVTGLLETHTMYHEKTLTKLPDWPKEYQISGDLRQWEKVIYRGEEMVGAIWMSKPGKLQVESYPYDQMVLVLEGDVTLNPTNGEKKVYRPGDLFFVPKGYSGTWEMDSDYKEFIIVEKKAWETYGE
ncbi:DUF861 domain-containing protein [Flammeovirga yaeyamensis]|uniref:DUF861 domain-containing protein n=1 Tax=Flammeovirga yaeyamensis TaxID=367791 RepID=A0AAX1N9C6_9BACT|nr:cupin domain-containing protein [Flammeovirga yaeyamensis]MBB3699435.1 putative cupin superfamily protein [Flammeovirga yaeyamensis]NMF35308.1 DUF861 domain-containing protein [Flammeovirga yaeyamensis]QWG04168.1 DUF861 domain-containing protein [Flammeovirga yaeyamensis]